MRRLLLWTLAVLCTTGPTSAQILPSGPQVLTFFSDLDDSEQPYAVYIPKKYDAAKKYPLVVMLHGAGSNHRLAMRRVFGKSNIDGENDVEASLYFPKWDDVEYIVAAPYARGTAGYQGLVEKDVMDMLADVQKRFSIDENRMYLTGLSMGGGGTLWIGLSRPDLWAAIAAVCPAPPPGTDALAQNALNMAVQFVHGDADPTVPVSISRDWVARLRTLNTPVVEYRELPGVDHWSWVQAYEGGRIFEWFSQFTRNPYPERVRHASHDLKHGKSYWVRFDEKVPGEVAFIDARIMEKNRVEIETQHLEGFSHVFGGHPLLSGHVALRLTIDGQRMHIPRSGTEVSFRKARNGDAVEWIHLRKGIDADGKKPGLEGPIRDAFASRHVYVYGTADNPSAEILRARVDTALKAADWSAYRGEFLGRVKFYPRVVADRDVRASDYNSANLILFGTTETNSIIAAMADTLPIHLDISATSDYGLVYVYPNEHGHYVVVNAGAPWWRAINPYGRTFVPESQDLLRSFGDYCLYKESRIILAQGVFDNNWALSDEQKAALLKSELVRIKN